MGKRVLVADSDSAVQQVVSYFLKLEGFDVTTAGDGVSALETTERFSPDVILLAPALTGINGIEVSRLIKEKPQFRNIPIFFIAGTEEPLLNNAADIIQGFGIITKPIDPTKMVNTVKEYIGKGQRIVEERKESLKSIEELLGWDATEKVEQGVQEDASKEEMGQEKFYEFSDMLSGIIGEDKSEVGSQKEMLKQVQHDREQVQHDREQVQHDREQGFSGEEIKSKTVEGVEADLRTKVTDEMIENIIRKSAAEVIERVSREVVPEIAEREIKREIERLKSSE
ncbi:MAG: response regulator [Nitrospirae bacterium]|nr:response regulator [Nitrospirota bacterium]